MWEAAVWILVLGGLFALRAILATILFYYILPQGDRCPNCNAITLRVVSRGWNTLFPWLRTSWCYECGWDGLLRHGPMTPAPRAGLLTEQGS